MYHLQKSTERYYGYPYSGKLSNFIPLEFNTLAEAINARNNLSIISKLPFNIWDGDTMTLIEGVDYPSYFQGRWNV